MQRKSARIGLQAYELALEIWTPSSWDVDLVVPNLFPATTIRLPVLICMYWYIQALVPSSVQSS